MLISGPDDYGLSAAETLAHRRTGPTPDDFAAYWTAFRNEVTAQSHHWIGSVRDAVNDVHVPSVRAMRVVARVTLPASAPRGVVVVVHADEPSARMPPGPERGPDAGSERGSEPWTEHGLATVRLHVRGVPPSTDNIGDLGASWIGHHLDSADAWIARGAAADVVQAVRCARHHFGDGLPVGMYGAALGGGLAVIAAAQLAAIGEPPARLVLSHPDLGDWPWRLDRYCAGPGALVNEHRVALRDDRSHLERTLGLFDTALHAPAVTCPVLTRLAERDDVVPAPAAAAVHNALGGPMTWRFITTYGHYDGGLADLRRHAAFDSGHARFLDPAISPAAAVARLAKEPGL